MNAHIEIGGISLLNADDIQKKDNQSNYKTF